MTSKEAILNNQKTKFIKNFDFFEEKKKNKKNINERKNFFSTRTFENFNLKHVL